MRPLQSLPLEARIDLLSARCAGLPDTRRPTRVDSRLHDTLMRGCAMLCFQHASLLECQRQLQQRRGRCTLETRCGVHAVPSDPQRREMLDGVPPELRRQVLPGLFAKVRRAGWATDFPSTVTSGVPHGAFSTMLLDGRDDVHSTTVQGPGCVHRTDTGGEGHFRHTVGSATLVNAGAHRVFPRDVAEVRNSDGQEQQECAVQAAKRLLPRLGQEPPQWRRILGGDALYGHDPLIAQWRALALHPVPVGKPTSPVARSAGVEDMERWAGCLTGQWHEGPACRRRFSTYRIAPAVPLTASRRLWGPVVEGWAHDREGKPLSHHAWCTAVEVTPENVASIVRMGRSRWQIANAPCNVHKNQGDELEHNSGHGTETLSRVLYLLNLLACIAHMLLERGEGLSQRCVATTSRRELWHTLRTAMGMLLGQTWAECLLLYLDAAGPSP